MGNDYVVLCDLINNCAYCLPKVISSLIKLYKSRKLAVKTLNNNSALPLIPQ